MTKSPHTGGERGIVPDWRAIGITRRLEVHDPVACQPWIAPVTRAPGRHGPGVCVVRSALSDPDRSGQIGHPAASAPAVPTGGRNPQEALCPYLGKGPDVSR